MKHENTMKMMLYLLTGLDYHESWEKVEYNLGYILGDYRFESPDCYQKVRSLAKHIWAELHGFIGSDGYVIDKTRNYK